MLLDSINRAFTEPLVGAAAGGGGGAIIGAPAGSIGWAVGNFGCRC